MEFPWVSRAVHKVEIERLRNLIREYLREYDCPAKDFTMIRLRIAQMRDELGGRE